MTALAHDAARLIGPFHGKAPKVRQWGGSVPGAISDKGRKGALREAGCISNRGAQVNAAGPSPPEKGPNVTSLAAFVGAAVAEIAGCFAFWAWLRLDRSPLWLIPGLLALALFAALLTLADSPLAGRAYAAYGGIYIASALLWGWLVERSPPDRWDLLGALVCLAGMALILFGPRPLSV